MTHHFRIRWAVLGSHVHVSVWSAPAKGELHARNGQLIFSESEWDAFRDRIEGAYAVPIDIIEGGDPS